MKLLEIGYSLNQNTVFIKIDLAKVNYIKADRNYSYIFTKEKKYIIVCTLKK